MRIGVILVPSPTPTFLPEKAVVHYQIHQHPILSLTLRTSGTFVTIQEMATTDIKAANGVTIQGTYTLYWGVVGRTKKSNSNSSHWLVH